MTPVDEERYAASQREIAKTLGAPERTFRPSPANVAAAYVLGLAALAGGSAIIYFRPVRGLINNNFDLPLFAEKARDSWFMVAFLGVAGLLLVGLGLVMFYLARNLRGQTLYFCPDGTYWTAGKGCEAFPWDHVVQIKETVMHERVPIGAASAVLPRTTCRMYTIYRDDGVFNAIHPNNVSDIESVAGLLRDQSDARNIPWETVEKYE